MRREKKVLRKRFAGMAEYIIILALVAVGSIAVFQIFGDQIRSLIGSSAKQLGAESSAVDAETSKSLDDF